MLSSQAPCFNFASGLGPVGVGVGWGVGVGVGMTVGVGVGTGVAVGVGVGVGAGVAVGIAVGVGAGVAVGVGTGVGVGVGVGSGVAVGTGIAVGVGAGAAVGMGVGVGAGVAVGSGTGSTVGIAVATVATAGAGAAVGSGVGAGVVVDCVEQAARGRKTRTNRHRAPIERKIERVFERIEEPPRKKDLATCHSRQLLCVSLARGHKSQTIDWLESIGKRLCRWGCGNANITIPLDELANCCGWGGYRKVSKSAHPELVEGRYPRGPDGSTGSP